MRALLQSVARAWAQATRVFDQRARRERMMAIVAAAVLLVWVIDLVWIEGRRLQLVQLRRQVEATTVSQSSLTSDALQLQELMQAHIQQGQAEIDSLHRLLALAPPLLANVADSGVQAAAATSGAAPSRTSLANSAPGRHTGEPGQAGPDPVTLLPGLVTPQQMLPLLDELLCRQRGLRLRSLQTLGRTGHGSAVAASVNAVSPAPSAATSTLQTAPPAVSARGAAGDVALYRHGVELSVEGSYVDLLAYLQTLEALPQKLLWGPLTLEVEHHPQVLLKLEVYTLSTQPAWVEL
jgi:MSHA biogenesis protein MshJ